MLGTVIFHDEEGKAGVFGVDGAMDLIGGYVGSRIQDDFLADKVLSRRQKRKKKSNGR